ncbi:MAG: hypothetical protein QW469_01140 [Candidatus Aenigmatarchaeota archaeon]
MKKYILLFVMLFSYSVLAFQCSSNNFICNLTSNGTQMVCNAVLECENTNYTNITYVLQDYINQMNKSYYDYIGQKYQSLEFCKEDNLRLKAENQNLTGIKERFDTCVSDNMNLKEDIKKMQEQIDKLNIDNAKKESDKNTYMMVAFLVGCVLMYFYLKRMSPDEKINKTVGVPKLGR